IKVAYPIELFEPGNMPQILSSIAGNIFGMKAVKNLRLEDVSWPHGMIRSFKGPQFGIEGIRKILSVWDRPLTATVPKPKVGLSTEEYCDTAYKIWKSGIDFVKNDENLTSQNFIKFYGTTEKMLKIRDKVERETGEKKLYLANVSSETKEMIKRARFVRECGGEIVMVDILTVGWAGVQSLREECEDLGLAIYSHRAFHASFSRNPKHGMSMLCVANIARLIGTDAIHIGGMGKLVSPKDEIFILKKNLEERIVEETNSLLAKDWNRIKPVFPISSGGLHPGIIPRLIKLLGKDIILQVGGGVIGHKMGIDGGGKAVRQAIDATLQNIPLKEYARKHKELEVALKMWRYLTPI
ncbi:MAG: ribulose-bisphosphate carboxylase large subunit, partial [Candidatus Aenigmarchaeota archaeon]|nr:ribulose-bisphosphate carboxylase large subunit [Candidatus Aenigmarchaeota archaeon]